jgi:hypothetical protein
MSETHEAPHYVVFFSVLLISSSYTRPSPSAPCFRTASAHVLPSCERRRFVRTTAKICVRLHVFPTDTKSSKTLNVKQLSSGKAATPRCNRTCINTCCYLQTRDKTFFGKRGHCSTGLNPCTTVHCCHLQSRRIATTSPNLFTQHQTSGP